MSSSLKGRARVAPRWSSSSDETRPRVLALAALAAVFAAALALVFAPRGTLSSPGPLSAPHAKAEVKCASCHGAKEEAGGAATAGCRNCHGEHALRGGHARAFAAGKMGCATCHPAHGAETVVLADGARVPVVRASGACAACHDLSRAGDPLRPCVDAAGVLVRCMGEHDRGTTSPRACASQHTGSARFVARDEAARKATGTLAATRGHASGLAAWLGLGPIAAGLVIGLGARLVRRKKSEGTPPPAAPAPARRKLPVIDASRCLGCFACVDVCPFDVLDVERYVATVVRPDACCGAVACAEACPNGSLTMREEGDAPLGPRLSPSFESEATRGVFLAGDVTGVPLIKNAIVQARAAIDAVHARAKARGRAATAATDVDAEVLVVGAGPAGLAASLRAEEIGLSYVTLEQSTIAASIKSFPRGKLVFDAPVDLPLEGEIATRECTKEELVAHWTRIVRTRKPRILEQHRVVSCERDAAADAFVVAYERADASRGTLRVRAVVVAIGQRGTPRRLEAAIAPGAETMVADALFDARSFTGKRVLVVGLGDSAMEAAQALAHQPGTEVTIVHRGADFARGRAKNVAAIKALVEAGRIALRLGAVVTHVEPGRVRVAPAPGTAAPSGAGEAELEVDAVLALLGGVPSTALLERLGVVPQIVSEPRASKEP